MQEYLNWEKERVKIMEHGFNEKPTTPRPNIPPPSQKVQKWQYVEKELTAYLEELQITADEQRRAYIRARADGAVNMAVACQMLNTEQAAEWQNKFIAAVFCSKGQGNNGRTKSDRNRSAHRPIKDQT